MSVPRSSNSRSERLPVRRMLRNDIAEGLSPTLVVVVVVGSHVRVC